MKKIFLTLTLILALITLFLFVSRTKTTAFEQRPVKTYELARKKVNVDFQIEMAKDRMTKGVPGQVKTSKGLKDLAAERDSLIRKMNDQKAKTEKESRDEEQRTKTENLRLTLSFLGTLAGAFTTVAVALINRKK